MHLDLQCSNNFQQAKFWKKYSLKILAFPFIQPKNMIFWSQVYYTFHSICNLQIWQIKNIWSEKIVAVNHDTVTDFFVVVVILWYFHHGKESFAIP
jgi:hypothetical protein